jgi:D-serine deaminase-like pyridoxal phosphate-dependent protein
MNYADFVSVLAGRDLPAVVVDLDALDANIDLLRSHLERADVTLRVATKSIRVPQLISHILERGGPRFQGLMTYSAAETAFLADQGFDDFLLAYPVGRSGESRVLAQTVAEGARLVVAIDCDEHIVLLGHAAREAGVTLDLCLDVDMSWRPLRGRAHLGVRRSPIRGGDDARGIARRVQREPGVRLTSVLAYEAQIAGMQDRNAGSRHLDPARQLIKRRSEPVAMQRRAEVLMALRDEGCDIELVNGGGTGSVRSTSADPSVTEVTAGSGFLCPHLFDGYDGLPLQPAAFYALAITRRSDKGFVTCAGGGYPASGAAGADRLPIVHLPAGVEPLRMEGFGEVQTPMACGSATPPLTVGDPIICRHAKGGELAERFATYQLVRGRKLTGAATTYRGMGGCFL